MRMIDVIIKKRNGKTLTGNFPSTGITIEAGATVTFAGVYAEYSSDGSAMSSM